MRKAEALISDELPEGWQEVRDGNEIYYWHIWTGTIQYERPILSAVSLFSSFFLGLCNLYFVLVIKGYFDGFCKLFDAGVESNLIV